MLSLDFGRMSVHVSGFALKNYSYHTYDAYRNTTVRNDMLVFIAVMLRYVIHRYSLSCAEFDGDGE